MKFKTKTLIATHKGSPACSAQINKKPLKKPLSVHISTLLLASSSLLVPDMALADSCTTDPTTIISTAVTDQCELGNDAGVDQNLVVNANGSLATENQAAVLATNNAGTIVNNGAISATDLTSNIIGVQITGSTIVSIANNGALTVTGEDGEALGIDVSGSATVTSGITNSGTLTTITRNISSAGIVINDGVTLLGGVTNSGTITAQSDNGASFGIIMVNNDNTVDAITNTGSITAGFSGIALLGTARVTGDITNAGTITTQSTGILASTGSIVGGSITNSGSITTTTGEDNAGISVVGSTVTGNINNEAGGTISGETAISVTGSTISGAINNAGTLTGDAVAINIVTPGAPVTINNTGVINGSVQFADGTFNVNGGSITGIVNGIANSTVNFNSNFTTQNNFLADSIFIKQGAVLTLKNTLAEVAQVGTTTNQGVIFVPVGETGTIDDEFVQSGSGVLRTEVKSTSEFGKLVVTGSANFTASPTIDVLVTADNTLKNGDVISQVISANQIVVGSDFTVTDNSALLNFTADVSGGKFVNLTTNVVSIVEVVNTTNTGFAVGAATAFDEINAVGAVGDMIVVIDALNSLGSIQEVSDAIEQTVPVVVGQSAQMASSNMGDIGATVDSRVASVSGLNAGDALLQDKHFWLKPYGTDARQDERDGVDGYKADSWGIVVGFDGEISDQLLVGLALGYSDGDVESDSNIFQHDVDIEGYQLITYGQWTRSQLFATWTVVAGYNENDSQRNIQFGGLNRVADGQYDTWYGLLDFGLGYQFNPSSRLTLAPTLSLQYTYVEDDSYEESGAGGLNLNVESNDEDTLVLAVDGRAAYRFDRGMTLTGHLGVGYDFSADQSELASTFAGGGSVFITEGMTPDEWIRRAGLGFEMAQSETVAVKVNYDYVAREDFDNHSISATVRVQF